jgi:hypothetical protein
MNSHGFNVRTGKFAADHLAPSSRKSAMRAGAGIFSTQTSTGEVFSTRKGRRGGATEAVRNFALVAVNELNEAGEVIATKVRVRFGTVSPQLGTVLDDGVDAWPSGMTEGDDPIYAVDITGGTLFFLAVTASLDPAARLITSVFITTAALGDPVPANSCYLGAADVLAGRAVITDDDGRIGVGTQKVMVCGGSAAFWT